MLLSLQCYFTKVTQLVTSHVSSHFQIDVIKRCRMQMWNDVTPEIITPVSLHSQNVQMLFLDVTTHITTVPYKTWSKKGPIPCTCSMSSAKYQIMLSLSFCGIEEVSTLCMRAAHKGNVLVS